MDLTSQEQTEENLQRRIDLLEQQVRQLIREKHVGIEQERKNIAADMHDEMNAAIIPIRFQARNIALNIKNIEPSPDTQKISENAETIYKLASDFYGKIRNIINRLRPEVLEILGLKSALEDLIILTNKNNKTNFKLKIIGNLNRLDEDLDLSIYRLIQEAISNILKHANATNALVCLQCDDDKKKVFIDVTDNGVGLDHDNTSKEMSSGFGVIGMRERVFAYNGKLQYFPMISSGTRLNIELNFTKIEKGY